MEKYYLCHLYDDFSGSPKVLSQLVNVLNNQELDNVSILGSSSSGFISKVSSSTERFFYKRSNNKALTLFYYLLSQFILFFKLSFMLFKDRKIKNKVVVVNTLLPFSASLAGKIFANKTILYSHEISIKPLVLNSFLLKFHSIFVDKVIYVSNFLANELKNKLLCDYSVVHNSLDSIYIESKMTDQELEKKWSGKTILMLSSLKDYKGIPEFIQLASNMKNEGLTFTLIANCEPYEGETYFSRFSLPHNLNILYRPSDLLKWYQKSFLVLNMSRQNGWIETFGLTLIEGMSQFNPVIAPIVGGPVEVVSNSDSGFLIDSRNLNTIQKTILDVADNYNYWLVLARNAKLRAHDFSFAKYEQKIVDEIKEIN
ncbi:glycosyltransferase [Photobacterium sp. GJ3]|uniref:glycosyltransferase n=1 Tax=Photobacterium sp. GJ3 TaxID=2829502 RepID=UPI001B8AA538|nr:glycosyltransferase [Photobacterium sp. GJ3]QUJ68209.1 glycosyltransferase [Photobacterium sp. GJ3]